MEYFLNHGVELTASIALICVLGLLYSAAARWKTSRTTSDVVLGLCFGAVGVMEMLRPFEPMAGLIIDLRNIPVALAGAYLGWRGALICLGIVAAARLGFGGVGMVAGMLGATVAMVMGRYWASLMAEIEHRKLRHHLMLALLASLHLAAAFVLPPVEQAWFFSNAALPILAINLIVIPINGIILEVERRRHRTEEQLRSAAIVSPKSGLTPIDAFHRECRVRASAWADQSYTTALAIKIKRHPWLGLQGNRGKQDELLGAVHMRVQKYMPDAHLAGHTDDTTLLVPLQLADLLKIEELRTQLRRALSDEAFALSGFGITKIGATIDVVPLNTIAAQHKRQNAPYLSGFEEEVPAAAIESKRHSTNGRQAISRGDVDRLFQRAHLMAAHPERPTKGS